MACSDLFLPLYGFLHIPHLQTRGMLMIDKDPYKTICQQLSYSPAMNHQGMLSISPVLPTNSENVPKSSARPQVFVGHIVRLCLTDPVN